VAHLRGAAVQEDRRDADILELPYEIADRHLRLGAVADPRLDRHLQTDCTDDRFRHRDHRRRIAQPPRTCTAPHDLRDPAPTVEIEERGLGSRRDHGRAHQQLRVVAVDLDRGRPIIRCEIEFAPSLRRSGDHVPGLDELGHAHRRAELATQPPVHHITDVLHWSQHHWMACEQRGDVHPCSMPLARPMHQARS